MSFTQSSIDVFIQRKISERPSSSSEDSSQEAEGILSCNLFVDLKILFLCPILLVHLQDGQKPKYKK